MDYLQYGKWMGSLEKINDKVLNLIINGLPSIFLLQSFAEKNVSAKF